MITNYLPEFKVVEVNNLTGLRNGHMLSQFKAAAGIKKVSKGSKNFIENGIIVGLDKNGEVANYDKAEHSAMFLHYTEELNTYIEELKYFAVPVDEDGTYPRCIALYIGDTFTTNNYVNGDTDGESNAKYAKVVGGELTLQQSADTDSAFIVTKSTLPTGDDAYEFTYYRVPTVA